VVLPGSNRSRASSELAMKNKNAPPDKPDGAFSLQEIYMPDVITNSSRLFFARQSSSREILQAGLSSP